MTGISTRNLGCFSFLSLPTSLGLLRGFSKVVERQVLAWSMASSFEVAGLEEEDREEWMDMGLWGRVAGKNETWERCWWRRFLCERIGRNVEGDLENGNGVDGLALLMDCRCSLRRLEAILRLGNE